ncbi:ATP-binding protein [Vibrio europaeus]|uniref:AAA family ATPase n=1 Tax=Vibrio europaeus TaxID=300876 RepID=UPI00233F490B|nr:AAA family ATPase [Vibrio europaeus]MDC5819502.1 ATP-binding protein [Vibrio europaeus]MDC5871946.1 ATP-binding protein [Vibrio europaeus]
MKIIIVSNFDPGFSEIDEDHVLLYFRYWDDYGTKSTYTVSVYSEETGEYSKIGDAKIISTDKDDYTEDGYLKTSGVFDSLPDKLGFLGQSEDFYTDIKSILPDSAENVLKSLNDLSILHGLRDSFESSSNFESSLIRYSDAERALKLGSYIVKGEDFVDSYSFEFCNGNERHNTTCSFDYDSNEPIKSRINIIIGENGTGKTTYLTDLALSMSGRESKGEFIGSRPPFSKVISVSFSAFDTFEIPQKKRSFSYKYCGLRDKNGFMNRKSMLSNYRSSCKKISDRYIEQIWKDTLSKFIPERKLERVYQEFFVDRIYANVLENSYLSSGESILLYSFTQIIAETKKESLILFDEPELHLHPLAISNLIPAIKEMLLQLNAYTIIATHSPIILQQIPSKFVRVFDNYSGKLTTRSLELETFGENLNAITNEVFNTFESEQPYKKVLANLAKKKTNKEINQIFNNNLSLNCQLYLESLRQNEK